MPTAISRALQSTNAIEVAAFAIVFSRDLRRNEIDRIMGLRRDLGQSLPGHQPLYTVSLNVSAGDPGQQIGASGSQQLVGAMFHETERDGSLIWAFRIERNTAIVNCRKFTSWSEVWARANGYFAKLPSLLDADDLKIVGATYQVVDKFVYDTKPSLSDYQVTELFRPGCSFLPSHVLESGLFWHVFQGWWTGPEGVPDRMLSVLNIASAEESGEVPNLFVSIDHQLTRRWTDALDMQRLIDPTSEIVAQFSVMHASNLGLMKQLLNSEKLMEIGLAEVAP